jgi:hypothetical protein
VTASQVKTFSWMAWMSSTALYDVILSSSGVRISFAMCVTFLGRGEGRGESGVST